MGLGAPRKRTKLGHDPNNTAWSRSSSKFGQHILQSQGWKPGDSLGINKIRQASTSQSKVTLKDDNLGLGARRGVDHDGDTTGLNNFQDLLGRLNGKSDVVLEKEQRSRESFRKAIVTGQRWGKLNFVSGGLLNGDKPHESSRTAEGAQKVVNQTQYLQSELSPMGQSKDDIESGVVPIDADICGADKSPMELVPQANPNSPTQIICKDKSKRRSEKMERKLQRRLKRERKQKSPSLRSEPVSEMHPSRLTDRQEQDLMTSMPQAPNTPTSTVTGRHAVRQRYIKQKKMAITNSKALNEILMVKA